MNATYNAIAYLLKLFVVIAILFWFSDILIDAVGNGLTARIAALLTNAA